MLKLGYTTGLKKPYIPLKKKIEFILSIENDAIELGFNRLQRLNEALDDEDVYHLKQFKYVSIHAPIISSVEVDSGKKNWMEYPSKEAEEALSVILKIAKKINAQTILFHPDLITDFSWLNKKLGSLISFENMDKDKQFGTTITDMELVFSKSPQAKWVCDLNHIYTLDPSMQLSNKFHQFFGDRLIHYHLSSYGGFHDCFSITHEDVIMHGLKDFTKPIIHEGGVLRKGLDLLIKEHQYVKSYFDNYRK